MKYNIKAISLLCLIFVLFSCSDFLDQIPEEKLNEEILFDTREDAIRILTHAYSFTPHTVEYAGDCTPGNAADDIDVVWDGYGAYNKDIGLYSANSNIFNRFAAYYEGIRYCMYFNSRIDECKDPKIEEKHRNWWKGEADFLQAWYYFILMTQYGPIPVLDRIYNSSEIESMVETGYRRPSMAEVAHHIDSLLVSAEEKLDLIYLDSDLERASRANKVAASAFRAKLWLYMASPLYNGMKHPVTNKDYTHLAPKDHEGNILIDTEYDPSRWAKALELAEHAIEVADNGKRKLTADKNGYTSYWKTFAPIRSGDAPIEALHYAQTQNIGGVRKASLPLSWTGYSGFTTFIEHANEYFMANGLMPEDDEEYEVIKKIDDFFEYEEAGHKFRVPKKYTKRDTRFYVNVLFPGQYSYAVLGNEEESTSTRWAYNTSSDFTDYVWFRPWYGGPDGYTNRIGRNFTPNGFTVAKWISKTDNISGQGDYGYSIFRLAELYLIHAEAAIENDIAKGIDPATDPEVFKYWDKVRERVQLPTVRDAYEKAGITLDGKKLRELIHRERRIELAFEGQRYYDNRRWLDAEREGGPKHGFDIYKSEDKGFWNENYVFETRVFSEKMYFMPILQVERDKNKLLTQNVGW